MSANCTGSKRRCNHATRRCPLIREALLREALIREAVDSPCGLHLHERVIGLVHTDRDLDACTTLDAGAAAGGRYAQHLDLAPAVGVELAHVHLHRRVEAWALLDRLPRVIKGRSIEIVSRSHRGRSEIASGSRTWMRVIGRKSSSSAARCIFRR